MPIFIRVIYKVLYDALYHFAEEDGWAMASHVALSSLLAVFPFMIFGTALASFLGADEFSKTAVHLIFDTWPEVIAEPISKEVVQVLTIQHGGLLTISVLAAAYFASNGVEALRISLNRAYRVYEQRPWYITRLISLAYVLAAVVGLAAVSLLLVFIPLAAQYVEQFAPLLKAPIEVLKSWGAVITIAVVTAALFISHMFMPAGRRKFYQVLPGILFTLIVWAAAAYLFAFYIGTFANYTRTYAGLASIMIVLVFLYMIGVIFIIGAEINAAMMKFRVFRLFSKGGLIDEDSQIPG
ncbi:YihY/virulence factor BrkB family protein [Rhizobium sp. L1K21]|uniref:YihY/virulence factor BrkB family protein n=1 Tax=Rhizobium sp. L1K21 TaxID=2954933 RepID=UPI002092F111|nr:YihY/virulence factor BrkB family protein [Rhizobium sp. L1K21]MCO6188185.1 YihY/virulence factor BrkB family protein [Rhizobium sp. L1K21]